jgi:hypothetical protein
MRLGTHVHCFTHWKPWLLEPGIEKRTPDYILPIIEGAGLDGVFFVNFGAKDKRYEAFVSQPSRDYFKSLVRDNAVTYQHRNTGKQVHIIKANEVRTLDIVNGRLKQSDLLYLGVDADKTIRHQQPLVETLEEEGRFEKVPVIACVPNLAFFGMGYSTLDNLRRHFTGFEPFSGNSQSMDESQIRELERKYRLPAVPGSDSHSLNAEQIGAIGIDIDLDFSSASDLRESIRMNIARGTFDRIIRSRNYFAPFGQRVIHGLHLVREIVKRDLS